MGRFDNAPPYKSKIVSVPEWLEQFGEVEIKELDGPGAQAVIDLSREARQDGGVEGRDVEYYANILWRSITIGGEVPPLEWLNKVPFATLKKLGDIALEVNGLSQKAEEQAEKN
jgi:hypothetical protein